VDLDNASGSMGRQLKDSSSPSLLIHYAGNFHYVHPPQLLIFNSADLEQKGKAIG
jgi:hypothetical protein